MARTTRDQVQQVHISLNLAPGVTPLVSLDSDNGQGHPRIKPRHGSKTTQRKHSWGRTSTNSDRGSTSPKRGMGVPGLLGILIGVVDRVIRMWVSTPPK